MLFHMIIDKYTLEYNPCVEFRFLSHHFFTRQDFHLKFNICENLYSTVNRTYYVSFWKLSVRIFNECGVYGPQRISSKINVYFPLLLVVNYLYMWLCLLYIKKNLFSMAQEVAARSEEREKFLTLFFIWCTLL